MSDYAELLELLRYCSSKSGCIGCKLSEAYDCTADLTRDAAAAIEALQAEVERLKASNEELREKQTYIDHYGDKWMTSAKDVPTSAYNHGYMDGKNEAEQALEPKRGEMVEVVRCKDCIHFTQNGWCDREFDWFPVEENDFCSMAEKMEVQDA